MTNTQEKKQIGCPQIAQLFEPLIDLYPENPQESICDHLTELMFSIAQFKEVEFDLEMQNQLSKTLMMSNLVVKIKLVALLLFI